MTKRELIKENEHLRDCCSKLAEECDKKRDFISAILGAHRKYLAEIDSANDRINGGKTK